MKGPVSLAAAYRPADTDAELLQQAPGELLVAAAAAAPDTVAVVEIDEQGRRRQCTYRELLDAATRTAHALLGLYSPGDRIAIWAPSSLNWEVMQFGAAMAGLILVTVNPAYRASELNHALRQSGCAGIALKREYRGADLPGILEKARAGLTQLRHVHDLDSWDPPASSMGRPLGGADPGTAGMIQYTSGTTGLPKAALLSHRGVVNNARLFARRLGIGEGTIWLNPLPMFHLSGCGFGALGAISTLSTHVVFPFEPGRALSLIESERASFMPAVPTMLIAMLEHSNFATSDLSSLHWIVSGATTVPPEIVRRVEDRFGATFGVVFGQTEVSGVICQTLPGDTHIDKAERVGVPLAHTEIKVTDTAGKTLRCGEVGEIRVRGFGVMLEYFNSPVHTREVLTADRWLRTGDLGFMDDRGYLQVTGRLKDMIIRGGENIYPREIEDRLYHHPAVVDVAVVGVRDPQWGEQVTAFVRLTADADVTAESLREFLRADLAASKVPKIWAAVPEFPLTPSGKVQKFVLREWFEKGEYERID